MAYSYWRCSASTICSGGTAIASGSNGSYPVSNAFDGDYSSYWWANTTGAGSWLGYHFATQKKIAAFYFESAFTGYYANGYVFEYSNDGTNWTSLDLVVSPSGVWSYGYNYVVNPVLASYYRLRCLGVSTSTNAWCVDEVLMFEAVEKYNISENLCSGGTVISGGDYSTTYAKEKAFDLSVSTKWYSSQSGTGISGVAYIGYQFTSAVKPGLVLACGLADDDEEPTSIKLQNSDDGTTWNDVATYARNTDWNYGMYPINGSSTYLSPANGAYICLVVPSTATAAAYWRLIANANLASGKYWFLYELAFANIIPIVNITNYDKTIISDKTGKDECNVTFQTDIDIIAWEARAGGEGLGQGLLVGSSLISSGNVIPEVYGEFTDPTLQYLYYGEDVGTNITHHLTGGTNNSSYITVAETSVLAAGFYINYFDYPIECSYAIGNTLRVILKVRCSTALTLRIVVVNQNMDSTMGFVNSTGTGNWETVTVDIVSEIAGNSLFFAIGRDSSGGTVTYDVDSVQLDIISSSVGTELLTVNQQGVETDLTGFDHTTGEIITYTKITGTPNEAFVEALRDENTATPASDITVSHQLNTIYFSYDFGTAKTVAKIRIYTNAPDYYGLVYSDDGTSWTAVGSVIYASAAGWKETTCSAGSHRYWAISSSWVFSPCAIKEIEFYQASTSTGSTSTITRDTTNPYEGNASLKIVSSGTNGGVLLAFPVTADSGETLNFSFMIYAANTGIFNCFLFDTNNLENIVESNFAVATSNSWIPITVSFTLTFPVTNATILIAPIIGVNTWIDKLSVIQPILKANTDIIFKVENEELTQGDLNYRITVYAQGKDGTWSGY